MEGDSLPQVGQLRMAGSKTSQSLQTNQLVKEGYRQDRDGDRRSPSKGLVNNCVSDCCHGALLRCRRGEHLSLNSLENRGGDEAHLKV